MVTILPSVSELWKHTFSSKTNQTLFDMFLKQFFVDKISVVLVITVCYAVYVIFVLWSQWSAAGGQKLGGRLKLLFQFFHLCPVKIVRSDLLHWSFHQSTSCRFQHQEVRRSVNSSKQEVLPVGQLDQRKQPASPLPGLLSGKVSCLPSREDRDALTDSK